MTTTSISTAQSEHERSGLGPVGLRFRSILVATDCSPASATAVKMAARLAKNSTPSFMCCMRSCLNSMVSARRGPVPELALWIYRSARENLHKYAEHIPELRTVAHKEIVFLGSPVTRFDLRGNLMTLICWCLAPMAGMAWRS